MRERFAIIFYEVRRQSRAGLGIGYLVETPDGQAWCFPSPETEEKFPGEIDAFPVDLGRLRPQPDNESGRKCFVYAPATPP